MTAETLKVRLATSRPVLIAILAISVLLALGSAVLFQDPGLIGKDKVLTDFDAFYIAGSMAADGQAAETYESAKTFAAQKEITPAAFKRAMFYGGVMGSFAVERFGTERLQQLTREEIDARFALFRELSHLD